MSIINKLNNYNWDDEEIEKIKNYIKHKILPDFKTYILKERFIEKYKHFIIKNNKLFYKPLNLEVVPNDQKDKILQKFYDEFLTIGSGKVSLYKKIILSYININREYCGDFLSKQASYQINTEVKHITNKPILASSCGERISIDLVDVSNLSSYNKNYSQILTAIDYYSRKVWARPLKFKNQEVILNALKVYLKK